MDKTQSVNKITKLESVAEKALGKKLNLPDSLGIYAPFTNYLENDKSDLLNSEYKIYSRIDASCGTCIGHINSWNELVPEFNKHKVPIILICTSDDDFELIKHFYETGEILDFGYPFFLDKKNEFVQSNSFMLNDKGFETVLTDKNDNILLLGSPIQSKSMHDLYLQEIQKRLKE
ncbi:MAG: hypothetical protein ACK5L5_04510 [Bacteroidales bacterium]